MHKISVPKLNNNDDSCILLEWLFQEGQRIEEQEVIALLETSKATTDLLSETAGIIHPLVQPGDECQFGEIIGYLFVDEEEKQLFFARPPEQKPANPPSLTLTDNARRLMEENGITEEQVLDLGKRVITTSDIENLISAQPGAESVITLSRRQAAIAETVSLSHQSIPGAFALMKVSCDKAQEMLRDQMAGGAGLIGLPELLIKTIADLSTQFLFFFGTLQDNGRFTPARHPNIGVTMDIGKGLFIPVIKDAAAKSLEDIAGLLMEMRYKALRDSFKEEDLRDGHITLSLNTDEDVVFALPIILPSQTCILSLSSTQTELALAEDGRLIEHHYCHLGLAYDHRAINGYDAVKFLTAIKARIEQPEGAMR